jgi:Mn2+/Fe2+ NRAMP family transporter
VINGVVAVPVMIIMMHMTANRKVMGKFRVNDGLRAMGWLSTLVMFFAALGMLVTSVGLI